MSEVIIKTVKSLVAPKSISWRMKIGKPYYKEDQNNNVAYITNLSQTSPISIHINTSSIDTLLTLVRLSNVTNVFSFIPS